MDDEILAAIKPSAFRRWLAIGLMIMSGGALIYFAMGPQTTGFVWKTVMLAAGVGLVVLADRMRRATMRAIELTPDGLRESTGRVLCRLDEIESMERGAFAFKPSNGLLVRLKSGAPAAWAPGLWWRIGRKIGIGGVTSASQAKVLSDMISIQLIQRSGNTDQE